MLKALAAIQFRSRGEWRNLSYFAISQAFRHREVQKDCQIESEKSGICHSKIVHSLRLHTFNHCFPCGCGFNQTKKREKAVNVSLFTVGHVFVGFVERVGSESGMRNSQPFSFVICGKSFRIYNIFCVSFFKS